MFYFDPTMIKINMFQVVCVFVRFLYLQTATCITKQHLPSTTQHVNSMRFVFIYLYPIYLKRYSMVLTKCHQYLCRKFS